MVLRCGQANWVIGVWRGEVFTRLGPSKTESLERCELKVEIARIRVEKIADVLSVVLFWEADDARFGGGFWLTNASTGDRTFGSLNPNGPKA